MRLISWQQQTKRRLLLCTNSQKSRQRKDVIAARNKLCSEAYYNTGKPGCQPGKIVGMTNGELDDVDKTLLRALTQDSRTPAASLALLVGLTRQAVTERMERLRSDGVIDGFTLRVSPEKQSLTMRAFLAITLLPACSEKQETFVLSLLEECPWVQECYRVTGDDYFQARVVAPSIAEIRQLVLDLRATHVVQSTRTTLALETLFEKSALGYVGL